MAEKRPAGGPYKAPRGTQDVLPADQPYWDYVRECVASVASLYGYRRIDTPIFEDLGLFVRGVGEGTDIVEKEMYTFEDRGGSVMALKPEGTAPALRAFLEHGLGNQPAPVKLWYLAPSFRYERPQAGRLRQFHQFGVEALGEVDPALDAEVIEMAWRLFERLGLDGLGLKINSIGDAACRPAYLESLRDYYRPLVDRVCRDCRNRFEKNPLRLLDCKETGCKPIIAAAPKMSEALCAPCATHFAALRSFLEAQRIPYEVEPRMVRGLDYYTRTVFEIQPEDVGGQSTVLAGGRYDGLMQELGGRPTPGIGFATGIERIVLNLKRAGFVPPAPPSPLVFIAYQSTSEGPLASAKELAAQLTSQLRVGGVQAALGFGDRSLRALLRAANTAGAAYVLVLGDEEMQSGQVQMRRMADSATARLPFDDALKLLIAGTPDAAPFIAPS
ncbi:MAG: histidine--tRNA ligase [Chloroflexi bacterium]|nr:histidine--tRNA ligase [Chloroflexota bacterium]